MLENIIDRIKGLFLKQEELTKDEELAMDGYTKYKSGINGKIPSKDKMSGGK